MNDLTSKDDFQKAYEAIPKYRMTKDVKDHLSNKLNISDSDIKEMSSVYGKCITATVNQAYLCCRITMIASKSKAHQEAIQYIAEKHFESGDKAIQFLRSVAKKSFSIDSPRTAHLPEVPRKAISKFSSEYANDFYDGEKIIKIFKEDQSDECEEKKFKDLDEEEIDQCFTSTGIYRSKSKQWRHLASRDRSAVDRHIRDDMIWIKQGRNSMSEVLVYVDELIKNASSKEVAASYIDKLDAVLTAAKNKVKNSTV